MCRDDKISERQKREQARVFRLAQRDCSMTLKAISLDSGIGYTTIQSYAKGESVMSIASLFRLVGVIPDELLSLLMPEGRQIVRAPEHVDHDDICHALHDYLQAKSDAHHPESPGGREIAPCEDEALRSKVASIGIGRAA